MKNILIIDDEEPILVMTKGLLEDYYKVATVNSGKAAFDLIKKGFVPNLILLDIYMPEMGGWNVLLRIRNICEARKILIAIYTSSEDPEGLAKAKLFGAVDFIHKPLSGTELIEKIEELLK
jgi:putative two-component system response regulator